MSKYYYKKKKNSWDKVFKDTYKEFTKSLRKKFKNGPVNINYNQNINYSPYGGAKICVIVLIVVTLLFSGLGFYAWVILGMLFLILQFL